MARIDQNLVAEAIGLPPEAAIAFFKAKGYAISWDWRDQASAAEKQAFTVAKAMRMDVLQDIKGMVQKSLDDGITLAQFRKELEPRLAAKGWWGKRLVDGPNGTEIAQLGSPHRLQTIYRTNMQSAYMAGRSVQQVEDADERPFLEYIAVSDSTTRPEHMAMNGKIFPINDPIWNTWTPPCGYNCRCRTRALTAEQAGKRGGVSTKPDAQPDPGFRNNPAKEPWKPDMREYDPEIKAQAEEMEKERPGTPTGTPVSKALTLPTGKVNPILKEAVDAIDSVHGDGDLPSIPILTKGSKRNTYGSYHYRRGAPGGREIASHIWIKPTGDHPRMTLAHELGHFIDNQAMADVRGHGSADSKALEGFRKALADSAMIAKLKDILKTGEIEFAAGEAMRKVKAPRDYIRYLLTTHESWARAYAQYIAVKSKNPKMRNELAVMQAPKPGFLPIPTQWDDADFAPIEAAIDIYFKSKGWIK